MQMMRLKSPEWNSLEIPLNSATESGSAVTITESSSSQQGQRVTRLKWGTEGEGRAAVTLGKLFQLWGAGCAPF